LKNFNKIDNFVAHSSILNLRYAEYIKGFNPYDILRQHLQTLGLGDYFVNKHLPQNKYSGDNSWTFDVDQVQTV